jgi:hypothetical protein
MCEWGWEDSRLKKQQALPYWKVLGEEDAIEGTDGGRADVSRLECVVGDHVMRVQADQDRRAKPQCGMQAAGQC